MNRKQGWSRRLAALGGGAAAGGGGGAALRRPGPKPVTYAHGDSRTLHRGNAAERRELVASGKGSGHGTAEWVWAADTGSGWDKTPVVPAIYADTGAPS